MHIQTLRHLQSGNILRCPLAHSYSAVDSLRRPVWMVMRNRSLICQPCLSVICKRMTPSIEAGSPDPEVSAGLANIARRRSVIQNAQLAPDFLLVVGH